MSVTSAVHPSRRLPRGLFAWLAAALVVGGLELNGRLYMAVPQLLPATMLLCAFTVLLFHRRSQAFREFTAHADLRPAILFHVIRVGYGVAFIARAAEGSLHPTFASVAGPGDIAAGALALVAAFAASSERRRVVWAWNALALVDIVLVLAMGIRLLFTGEWASMSAFGVFPYTMLPIFVVPTILLTHAWIFARLRSGRPLRGA